MATTGASAARPAPVIDAHCHAGPGDGFTGPWDTRARLDRYLRRCDEAGIGRCNLFAAFHSDYRVANRDTPARRCGWCLIPITGCGMAPRSVRVAASPWRTWSRAV